MWIFLNDAFVSIVAHREKPEHLHVRARIAGDLERAFPGSDVLETPHGDYRFRADIPRKAVARVMGDALEAIEYPNFKGSIAAGDRDRYGTYTDVWSSMLDWQRRHP